MTQVFLFMDMEFSRGRGTQVENSWKFQEMGSTIKPPTMENPRGWGSNPPWDHCLISYREGVGTSL